MKRITMTLAVTALFIISARGQGFQNLNFETGFATGTNFPGNPGNGVLVSVAKALPDWTAYDGPGASSYIYYVSNNSGSVSSSVELESGSLALSRNSLSVGLYEDGEISQTAVLPDNATSLQFEAVVPGAAGFSVTLGGQNLSLSVISEDVDYYVYGANIPSDMDGQMEALDFSCFFGSGGVLLNNIEFMPTPEPSEYALIGLGAIVFGFRAFSKNSKR